MLSRKEENRVLKALNRVFLDNYPNAGRRGCPGSGVLKAIASRRLTLEEAEPWINHLSSCSPCTREFADLRKNSQRRRMVRLSAAAAGLLLAVAAGTWLLLRQPSGPAQFQAVTLDLTGQGILRGSEQNPPNPPLQLAKGHLDLTVYLPVGSESGMYEMQVVREPGRPIWSAQKEAKLENYKATLHVQADLTHLKPGLYLLAIRPNGWNWTYYPLLLK